MHCCSYFGGRDVVGSDGLARLACCRLLLSKMAGLTRLRESLLTMRLDQRAAAMVCPDKS